MQSARENNQPQTFLTGIEFKPVKLRLKIDPVLYPARAEGLVNIISKRVFIQFDQAI